MAYEYSWVPGPLAASDLVEELASLYSDQYGYWSLDSPVSPGQRVRLSSSRLRKWLTPESKIALAKLDGRIIGYAIAVQAKVPDYGVISWVTQLVVHQDHRQHDVGKTLLFSIWGFSSHFAWGLVTANPYAVRALEKATRRRCSPERTAKNRRKLISLGVTHVPYVSLDAAVEVTPSGSRVNTKFFLDHSAIEDMLARATTDTTPWKLGSLPAGWEWFAFTFHDQPEIGLTPEEIEEMLTASDQVAKHAYSRMLMNAAHKWARHAAKEADFIIESCHLTPGQTTLDIGCGTGRHVLALAEAGFDATGVDYLDRFVVSAREQATLKRMSNARFVVADCRVVDLGRLYDAVVCVYDVIGSYTDDEENHAIVHCVASHLKPGGYALISVMNFALTEHRAKHFFSLTKEPNRLLELEASRTMEQTGDVFNPDFYMIETATRVIYRKEQFAEGNEIPVQLIVRDRRYLDSEITAICERAGLEIVWSRFVRAGHWDVPLDSHDEKAKEILVLCKKPHHAA